MIVVVIVYFSVQIANPKWVYLWLVGRIQPIGMRFWFWVQIQKCSVVVQLKNHQNERIKSHWNAREMRSRNYFYLVKRFFYLILTFIVSGMIDSGKSTIVKQIKWVFKLLIEYSIKYHRIIFDDHVYTTEEYLRFKPVIFSNTIEAMLAILEAMNRSNISFDDPLRQVDFYNCKILSNILFTERCGSFSCLY